MSAITGVSDSINLMTGGGSAAAQHLSWWTDNRVGASAATATIIGRMHSLWTYNKSNGATGSTPPISVAAPDKSTTGAIPYTNPGGGRQLWVAGVEGFMSQQCVGILYDRLLHISGLSGTVTTAQTVGGTLTRNTSGEGNQIWVEIYSQIGSTATTITASYTNQAGTSGRTTQAVAIGGTNNREVTRIIPLTLQAGDTGVQVPASVTLAATTGTAGNFGITIARPLCIFNNENAGASFMRDFLAGMPASPELVADMCLAVAVQMGNPAAVQGMTFLHLLEK